MDTPVSIEKGKNPYETTYKALQKLPQPSVRGLRVLLKPNVSRLLPYTQGATTHPQVVAAAIDYFRECGAAEIAVGESPITGVHVPEAYVICGIKEITSARKVPLLDFDSEPYQILKIPNGQVINQIKVTWFWEKFNFIVSIPVMKTHLHTGATLSIKNMKGMLWRRQKAAFHMLNLPDRCNPNEKELDLAICDMASVLYPHMVIIDGSIGMEGLGPGAGQPKGAGLIVAAHDALAADWITSQLMGINPEKIAHLHLLARKKSFDPKTVQCLPSNFEKMITPFLSPPKNVSFRYPGINVLDQESCSACQNTLYVFLEKYHHRLKPFLDTHGTLNLALGKGVKTFPKETICIGNCCGNLQKSVDGSHVVGCPPTDGQIWDKVQRMHKSKELLAQSIIESQTDSAY
jgi:uncharacterized protein (DUF362 family)